MLIGAKVEVRGDTDGYRLRWERVFDILPHLRTTYLLNVGTQEGWTDVIHNRKLLDQHVIIPLKPGMHELNVVLVASYNTGSETRYIETVRMDK
jgi:hypothetical protein